MLEKVRAIEGKLEQLEMETDGQHDCEHCALQDCPGRENKNTK